MSDGRIVVALYDNEKLFRIEYMVFIVQFYVCSSWFHWFIRSDLWSFVGMELLLWRVWELLNVLFNFPVVSLIPLIFWWLDSLHDSTLVTPLLFIFSLKMYGLLAFLAKEIIWILSFLYYVMD